MCLSIFHAEGRADAIALSGGWDEILEYICGFIKSSENRMSLIKKAVKSTGKDYFDNNWVCYIV